MRCACSKPLFWGWVVIVPAMILAIPRNELNDVLVHFFDESVEFRQDTDFMDQHLSGNTLLELLAGSIMRRAASPIPGSWPRYPSFADWFREQPPVRHVSVITDTFRQAQHEHARRRPGRLPDSGEPGAGGAVPAALRALASAGV